MSVFSIVSANQFVGINTAQTYVFKIFSLNYVWKKPLHFILIFCIICKNTLDLVLFYLEGWRWIIVEMNHTRHLLVRCHCTSCRCRIVLIAFRHLAYVSNFHGRKCFWWKRVGTHLDSTKKSLQQIVQE